jgi:hypothetical protein
MVDIWWICIDMYSYIRKAHFFGGEYMGYDMGNDMGNDVGNDMGICRSIILGNRCQATERTET